MNRMRITTPTKLLNLKTFLMSLLILLRRIITRQTMLARQNYFYTHTKNTPSPITFYTLPKMTPNVN